MALPGTLGCQLAGPPPPTQLAPTAGAPTHSWSSLYISSAHSPQAVFDTSLSEPTTELTSASLLPSLRQVARTFLFEDGRVEPGTSMELWVSPGWYWRGEQQLTQRAPWPRLLPASPPPPPGAQ